MNYGPDPTPEQLCEDDEDTFLRPVKDKEEEQTGEPGDNNDMGPKVADWRFGPAQIWYDILEVPETGDGFNYGFKLAEKVCKEYSHDVHVIMILYLSNFLLQFM